MRNVTIIKNAANNALMCLSEGRVEDAVKELLIISGIAEALDARTGTVDPKVKKAKRASR